MTPAYFFAAVAVGLFGLALQGLMIHTHLLRKILALNVLGSSVFLFLVAMAVRVPGRPPDPVCHAMVITGVVIAVSATALALALLIKLYQTTGALTLDQRSPAEQKASQN